MFAITVIIIDIITVITTNHTSEGMKCTLLPHSSGAGSWPSSDQLHLTYGKHECTCHALCCLAQSSLPPLLIASGILAHIYFFHFSADQYCMLIKWETQGGSIRLLKERCWGCKAVSVCIRMGHWHINSWWDHPNYKVTIEYESGGTTSQPGLSCIHYDVGAIFFLFQSSFGPKSKLFYPFEVLGRVMSTFFLHLAHSLNPPKGERVTSPARREMAWLAQSRLFLSFRADWVLSVLLLFSVDMQQIYL